MVMIRLAKIAVSAALAVFALIVAYDNVFDYNSNYPFVRHVLSMDTIFPDSVLRSRAIDSETMWRAAYALIIATEVSTGFLLALGAVVLLSRLRASAKIFNRAKLWAVAGLTLGFCLWFFGFVVIGGRSGRIAMCGSSMLSSFVVSQRTEARKHKAPAAAGRGLRDPIAD